MALASSKLSRTSTSTISTHRELASLVIKQARCLACGSRGTLTALSALAAVEFPAAHAAIGTPQDTFKNLRKPLFVCRRPGCTSKDYWR